MCIKVLANIKNHLYSRVLIVALFTAMVLCALNSDYEAPQIFYSNTTNTDSFVSLSDVTPEIASNEQVGVSMLREIITRCFNNFRLPRLRSVLGYALLFAILAFLCRSIYSQFFVSETVLSSHHFIITYIHDLDGMKA